MRPKKTYLTLVTSVLLLFVMLACKPSEKKNKRPTAINTEGMEAVTVPTMNKDAIRLTGTIDAIETSSSTGNIYIFTVKKIVKIGATFATVEPKINEKISLSTPSSVRYDAGQEVTVDVKTPFSKSGNLLQVVLAKN